MHILILPVSATCYSSTAIYPDAKRVIWMRSDNFKLAHSRRNAFPKGRNL